MKKILIIEDHKETQDILTRAIQKKYDCKILIADNGKEGLNLILEESPDLVLLDIALPQMDGITMLERLRITYDDMKTTIVALTAAVDTHTISKCRALDVTEYIAKPFTLTKLYDVIDKILGEK